MLRELEPTARDAAFILELMNDPSWLQYIGNKSVHDEAGALAYIEKTRAMYRSRGFGLWAVSRRPDGALLGLCGLIKRDQLEDVDLGFGFLSRHQGEGYGHESAAAVLAFGRERLGLARIVAITTPANAASCGLLEKLGFAFEDTFPWITGEEVRLYASVGGA
jgi:ribosomal-protein-alanine N-acetyltransferase